MDEQFSAPEWLGIIVAGVIGGVLLAFWFAAYVVELLFTALAGAIGV